MSLYGLCLNSSIDEPSAFLQFSTKTKAPYWVLFAFGAADGTFCSLTQLAVLLRNTLVASLTNPWRSKRVPDTFRLALQVPSKQKRHRKGVFFLVRLMGLEPIRLPTRPSNVRVCQFRHSRIFGFCVLISEGFAQSAKTIIHEYLLLSSLFL